MWEIRFLIFKKGFFLLLVQYLQDQRIFQSYWTIDAAYCTYSARNLITFLIFWTLCTTHLESSKRNRSARARWSINKFLIFLQCALTWRARRGIGLRAPDGQSPRRARQGARAPRARAWTWASAPPCPRGTARARPLSWWPCVKEQLVRQ